MRRSRPILLLAVVALLGGLVPASVVAHSQPDKPTATKGVVLFAADGMRPDLMEKYAAQGSMPTYAKLMKDGVTGKNGLVQAFPPNTGVGWYTLATGAYPAEAGSTNNTFFRSGDTFNNRTAAFSPGVLQADTIAESAERAGKKVVSLEWSGGSQTMTPVQGPVVDYRTFYSNRGLWTNYDVAGQPAGANAFGVQYQRYDLASAAGWVNVPASYSPAKQGTVGPRVVHERLTRRSGHRQRPVRLLRLRLHQRRPRQLQRGPGRPQRGRQGRRQGRRRPGGRARGPTSRSPSPTRPARPVAST